MKKSFRLIPMVILVTAMIAVNGARAQIQVVTTLQDLRSITESIGGELVEVFAIATGYQDPHFVDPKPSYILKLSKADMFVTVGLDLESGWVPPLLESSRNAEILRGAVGYVDASENVPLLEVPTSISREGGDIHIFGNPHYWLDPVRGKIIAENICRGLIRVDPEHEKIYRQNLKIFREEIDRKLTEWVRRMLPFKGTKVVAYHNAWPYFEQRFGFQVVEFLEPKPGIPPTASQLAKVIETMKREGLKIIISSPYFRPQSADLVAKNVGGGIVVTLATSVGAEEEIVTYMDLFDRNTQFLIDALEQAGGSAGD